MEKWRLLLVLNIVQACWSKKLNAISLLRAAPTIAGRISSAGRQKRTFGSIRLTCRKGAATQMHCCVLCFYHFNRSIYNRFQMKACCFSQLWEVCMASFTVCLNLIISYHFNTSVLRVQTISDQGKPCPTCKTSSPTRTPAFSACDPGLMKPLQKSQRFMIPKGNTMGK